jgi:hypothetical protein
MDSHAGGRFRGLKVKTTFGVLRRSNGLEVDALFLFIPGRFPNIDVAAVVHRSSMSSLLHL